MPWNSSANLSGGSIAAKFDQLYLLGETPSGGNIRNLVGNVATPAALLGTTSSRASDADGSHVLLPDTSVSNAIELTTAIGRPASGGFTFMLVFKPSTLAPNPYAGLFDELTSANASLTSFQLDPSGMGSWMNGSAENVFNNPVTRMVVNTIHCVVLVFNGTDYRCYQTGHATNPIVRSSASIPAPSAATAKMRVGNVAAGTIVWPGRYYAFGSMNEALSAGEVETLIANPEGTLLIEPPPPTNPPRVNYYRRKRA
jgi:hypothetical protein